MSPRRDWAGERKEHTRLVSRIYTSPAIPERHTTLRRWMRRRQRVRWGGSPVNTIFDFLRKLTNIQDGIDVSSDGRTAIVAEATYVEELDLNGKNIVLTSTAPPPCAQVVCRGSLAVVCSGATHSSRDNAILLFERQAFRW